MHEAGWRRRVASQKYVNSWLFLEGILIIKLLRPEKSSVELKLGFAKKLLTLHSASDSQLNGVRNKLVESWEKGMIVCTRLWIRLFKKWIFFDHLSVLSSIVKILDSPHFSTLLNPWPLLSDLKEMMEVRSVIFCKFQRYWGIFKGVLTFHLWDFFAFDEVNFDCS